jgi:hypothetical protein
VSDNFDSDNDAAPADDALAGLLADEAPEAADTADEAPEAVADEVVDAEDLLEEEPAPRPKRTSPYDRPGSWYVVHTQSGYEKKVKSNIESRINSMNMEDSIFEVVIPMEDVIEFKNGKKVVVQKKVYPGYLYIRCFLDDHSWDVIRNTPGVTGFVGTGGKPVPLSPTRWARASGSRPGPSPTSTARSPRSTRTSSRSRSSSTSSAGRPRSSSSSPKWRSSNASRSRTGKIAWPRSASPLS